MHWLEKLQQMYGPHVVYGPYIHRGMTPNRRFMILYFPETKKKIQKQYGKFKLEAKLGRILGRNETVNHRDTDPLNDDIGNLELLSLVENVKHAHNNGVYEKLYKLSAERMLGNTNAVGEKNPGSHFKDTEVVIYRIKAQSMDRKQFNTFRKELATQHKCGERPVRDMLTNRSYQHILVEGKKPYGKGRPV